MKRIALSLVLIHSVLANYFIGDDALNVPRYKVSLLSDKILHSQLQDVSIEQNMIMRDASGQLFLCNIPSAPISEEPVQMESDKEQDGDQYWSFEYCHNRHVRQFHVEQVFDGKVETRKETHSNHLGIYPENLEDIASKTPATELKQVGDQRSLIQQWTGGSVCDITGKPRSVEVQYQCDYQGHDRVSYFTEVSSCHYHITISTPRLCEEMRLSRLSKSKLLSVSCKPIVSDKLIEAEKEQQIEKAKKVEQEIMAQKHVDQAIKTDEKSEESLLEMIARLNQKLEDLKAQVQAKLQPEKPAEIPLIFVDENGNPISDELRQLLAPALKKEKRDDAPKLIHGFQ